MSMLRRLVVFTLFALSCTRAQPTLLPPNNDGTMQLPNPDIATRSAEGPDKNCGFEGDDNVYGIGIRLGIYFQWLATLISYRWPVPSEASSARDVNHAFQLSLFVALIFVTHTRGKHGPSGELHGAEAYLVFMLALGGVFGTAFARPREETDNDNGNNITRRNLRYTERHRSRNTRMPEEEETNGLTELGTTTGLLLDAGIIGYGIWLFFHGLHTMDVSTPCTNTVSLLGPVSLRGKAPLVLGSVLCMAELGFLIFLASTAYALFKAWKDYLARGKRYPKLAWEAYRHSKRNMDFSSFRLTSLSSPPKSVREALTLIPLVVLVLIVELTIRWASIWEVNSISNTGQLIPLVLGIVELVKIGYKASKTRRPQG